jgi:hypothetical protein
VTSMRGRRGQRNVAGGPEHFFSNTAVYARDLKNGESPSGPRRSPFERITGTRFCVGEIAIGG